MTLPISTTKLVAFLLAAALIPRVIMAVKLPTVCVDGVGYLAQASAIEQTGISLNSVYHLNLYPLILAFLNQCGLALEPAAKYWGVVCSTLVVLPLFGWTRRVFDDRVAAVACLIYASHAEFIEWSPEVIRDQTFWLLFTMGIYFSQRAAEEARLSFYCLAGFLIPACVVTRFEGVFLYVPLLLWTAASCVRDADGRLRRICGILIAFGGLPCLLILANTLWFRRQDAIDLLYLEPLKRLGSLFSRVTDIGFDAHSSAGPNGQLIDNAARLRYSPFSSHHLWNSVRSIERGLTPLYGILLLGGLAVSWRRFLRFDLLPTVIVNCLTLAGVWIHLWEAGSASSRYTLSVVILSAPCAALGIIAFGNYLAACRPTLTTSKALATILLILTVIGWLDAFTSPYQSRKLKAELGTWIRQTYGDHLVILGADEQLPLLGYYADAEVVSVPLYADLATLLREIDRVQPDLVYVSQPFPSDGIDSICESVQNRGFVMAKSPALLKNKPNIIVLGRESIRR